MGVVASLSVYFIPYSQPAELRLIAAVILMVLCVTALLRSIIFKQDEEILSGQIVTALEQHAGATTAVAELKALLLSHGGRLLESQLKDFSAAARKEFYDELESQASQKLQSMLRS